MNEKLKELEKKIEKNADKLDTHLEMIQKNSYALDILKDYKVESKRLFILLLISILIWLVTLGILLAVLIR